MTKLDDLKTLTTAKPLEGAGTVTVLSLNSDKEIDEALHALSRFFIEEDRRTAVQLDVRGDKVGYLNRRDFFSGQLRSKLGQSQSAELPSPLEFSFIKLACPVEGCETLILKIHYDERNPARCPLHLDKMLHVVA